MKSFLLFPLILAKSCVDVGAFQILSTIQQQRQPVVPSRNNCRSPSFFFACHEKVKKDNEYQKQRNSFGSILSSSTSLNSEIENNAGGGGGGSFIGGPKELAELLESLGGQGVGVSVDVGDGDYLDELMGGGKSSGADASAAKAAASLESLRTFDLKPKEVVQYLDKYVIQQTNAKKVLAVAICDHYNHCRRCLDGEEDEGMQVEYAKPNILLAGPTGVGK
eukprot:3956823-Ditylum_brightwellii.AAC.1